MDVGLDGMCAYFYRTLECLHCILWMLGLVASMRNGLRKALSMLVFTRPGPVGCITSASLPYRSADCFTCRYMIFVAGVFYLVVYFCADRPDQRLSLRLRGLVMHGANAGRCTASPDRHGRRPSQKKKSAKRNDRDSERLLTWLEGTLDCRG